MENRSHPEIIERLRHQIELAHGDPAAQDQDVVGLEVEFESTLELAEIIGDVVVRDALEALRAQLGDDAVRVGSSHLVWQDRLTRLDELVSGRDHGEHRLAAHADSRHTRRRGDGYFGRAQPHARVDQECALASIRAASMNVLPGVDTDSRGELGMPVAYGDLFDRNDAIATVRQYGARHNLDTRAA